jgi:hypothetical protein
MKTRTAACFAALLVVSLAAPGRAALKLSFKLGGGAAMLLGGAGDIERFREGERALADSWARDDFRTATFDWRKLSAVPELGGEVIIHVTPKIGLGLGVGYLEARAKAGYGTNASESWTPPGGRSSRPRAMPSSATSGSRRSPSPLTSISGRPSPPGSPSPPRPESAPISGGSGMFAT